MSLPNYSPSGKVMFGSVPWDNGYSNVRLYTSLESQYNDISSRMTISSDNYAYVGRNRTLKVSIEADRLYHCNYCMYRNASLTDGYIYCFVTDVRYVNDNTTEVTLETDVFNTYLYGVDWTIPACFIERETVPSESDRYLLTNEPDFDLTYVIDGKHDEWFRYGGSVAMTAAYPVSNSSLVDDILNPGGYYASPAPVKLGNGVPRGASFRFFSNVGSVTEDMETFFNGMTEAGSVESVVSIFTIPDFITPSVGEHKFLNLDYAQDKPSDAQLTFDMPAWGTSLDGYTPHNRKMLYWPYTFMRLTDLNGSNADLRYELMRNDYRIAVKYEINPQCEALAYPVNYEGSTCAYDRGICASCGTQGSFSVSQYNEWLARNAGRVVGTAALGALLGVAGVNMAGVAQGLMVGVEGGTGIVTAEAAQSAIAERALGEMLGTRAQSAMTGGAGMVGGSVLESSNMRRMLPQTTRGTANDDIMWATGTQGVHAQRCVVKAELAQQIDQFFDTYGYNVNRVEAVNITSRPAWNYVKTGNAAPRSTNVGAGSTAPFMRGRGTPAAALNVIRKAFDGGITFWHSTSGYGDYSQSNSL